jgi:hypothetical protein
MFARTAFGLLARLLMRYRPSAYLSAGTLTESAARRSQVAANDMRESFVAGAHFLVRYRFATLALVGAPRGARVPQGTSYQFALFGAPSPSWGQAL